MKTHLQAIRHQDLAGLLDHWLRFELLLAEGVPNGVKVLLASVVWRIHVKHSNHIWPAARGRQQRWTGGRGGGTGWLTGVVHTRLAPWKKKGRTIWFKCFSLSYVHPEIDNTVRFGQSSWWQRFSKTTIKTHAALHDDVHQREAESYFLGAINNKQHSFAVHCLQRAEDVCRSAFMDSEAFRDNIIFQEYSVSTPCRHILLYNNA